MAISNLGLTQAEVDTILRDIAGQPQVTGGSVAPGTPNTNSTVTTTGNTTGSAVKVAPVLPPALTPTGGSPKPPASTQPAKKSSGAAPALVGATTGFIFGGPVGAVVGGAGMWLLNKAITPK